jgi:phosphoribosylanthranilate isomerase
VKANLDLYTAVYEFMDATRAPRIKICCIGSVEEARLAVAAGASAVGLVSAMPSGPGVIAESLIAEIAPTVPPGVATFLLTCLQSAREIVAQQRRLRTNTIQICDFLTTGTYDELREALPGIKLVQVVHVGGEASIEEAVTVAPHVDAILLDSGNQQLAVKELGGTGRRHDWAISRQIREAVGVPVYLAGGLNAWNVRDAIETVGPFGLDVCSGVRTEGRLDAEKLSAFMKAVQGN